MVLIKMRLLIFLVLSRYGLACKYSTISQYQYIIGCRIAFSDISIFSHFLRLNYNSQTQLVAANQMVCHMMS